MQLESVRISVYYGLRGLFCLQLKFSEPDKRNMTMAWPLTVLAATQNFSISFKPLLSVAVKNMSSVANPSKWYELKMTMM